MSAEHPPVIEPLVEQVRAAGLSGTPLRIRGGGTKDFYGQYLEGELLDTRPYDGIVAYNPSELVLTARSGTLMAEIDEALLNHRQYLAFEPPRFGAGTTLGGVVASGLAGPGRMSAGGVRDYVLGSQLLDGRAQVLRFGGQVMKNVAGYDVSRALAGSLGLLGVILEISLKVLPLKAATTSLRFACRAPEALDMMSRWGAQPLPISAAGWCDDELVVRLAGASSAVKSAALELGGEPLADARAAEFWVAMRDQKTPFFAGQEPLWRIAVPHGTGPLALGGTQCFEWAGTQRWLRSEWPGSEIRRVVEAAGGHATLFRASDAQKREMGVFTSVSPAAAAIERNLRAAFDPHKIFNRGRTDASERLPTEQG